MPLNISLWCRERSGLAERMCVFVQKIPKAVSLCDAAENGHVDCLEVLHGFGVSLDEQKVGARVLTATLCTSRCWYVS